MGCWPAWRAEYFAAAFHFNASRYASTDPILRGVQRSKSRSLVRRRARETSLKSCSRDVTMIRCFPSTRGAGQAKVKGSDPCAYGGCGEIRLWNEWAAIPFRRDTWMERLEVRSADVKQRRAVKERIRGGEGGREKREKGEGEVSLKALGLTCSVGAAAAPTVVLPITPVQ